MRNELLGAQGNVGRSVSVTKMEGIEVERGDTLANQVCDRLREALISGVFAPGEKITIRAVARALGASPTPARDALSILAAEAALEPGPNRSLFVPYLSVERFRELIRIRLALEGLAGEEAASAATHEQISSVARANAELEGATDDRDFKKVMQKNREFHFGIYGAANMPSLTRIIESLWLRTGSYLNLIYPEFGIAHKGIENHERAVAALRARNGKELRAAIENDISYAAEHVIAVLRMRASAKNGQR